MKTKKMELALLVLVSMMTLFFMSCQNVEDNPAFKKSVKEINTLSEDMISVKGKVDSISNQLEPLIDDVDKLKREQKVGADYSAKIAELEQRIARLEASLKEARQTKISEPSSPSKKASVKTEEPAPKPKGFYYTVVKGDTLESIASKYNTSTAKILKDNNLPKDVKILPNQKLYIIPTK